MSEKVKVAGIQILSSEDTQRNLDRGLEFGEVAVGNGAQILCFSELFNLPWFPCGMDKNAFELAEPLSGPTITALRTKAKTWKVNIVAPLFEDDGKGNFYNSAVMINPEGNVDGIYRKMHVPQLPGWEEKYYFSPGNLGFPVFKACGLIFAVQICWDNFFPEGPRAAALAGAQLLFAPTAATAANDDLWRQAICANAFVNGMYVVRVNRLGECGSQKFSGGSFCAAPTGDLLEQPMGEVESVGLWTIDTQAIDFVRREWPFLRDRRPKEYLKLAGLKIVKEPDNAS